MLLFADRMVEAVAVLEKDLVVAHKILEVTMEVPQVEMVEKAAIMMDLEEVMEKDKSTCFKDHQKDNPTPSKFEYMHLMTPMPWITCSPPMAFQDTS